MKILDYNDTQLSKKILSEIEEISLSLGDITIMEFCGTHTHSIFRFGIRELLPENVTMLSGPGCPVCVTDNLDIDYSLALAEIPNTILVTFGDMVKVPGSYKSLQDIKAEGKDIRIVYSCMSALEIAEQNPRKSVIFLGVGFETTAPTVAGAIIEAKRRRIDNFFVYSMHKLTPPAMRSILELGEVKLDGILGPGHVSTVIGSEAWSFIPDNYKMPIAIAGFDTIDILLGIRALLEMIRDKTPRVVNTYLRAVKPKGNKLAQNLMYEVFEVTDSYWRGLGRLPKSGLKIREKYRNFDASIQFPINIENVVRHKLCKCGEVIRGVTSPLECPLFNKVCNPTNPIGPCMVSSEGTCSAYYLYGAK
ncbi:MAG: hydrogenase formation protein HypD [bacterium]|nr:hydrogenase formation protein HypD [bacterium]